MPFLAMEKFSKTFNLNAAMYNPLWYQMWKFDDLRGCRLRRNNYCVTHESSVTLNYLPFVTVICFASSQLLSILSSWERRKFNIHIQDYRKRWTGFETAIT
jgi:hypothetical protein